MLYPRNLFPKLKEHLFRPEVTVITGMRRVGKSTALRYLYNEVAHENKVYLDLERADLRFIVNQTNYKDIEINIAIEGIDFSKPAVIFFDEIQLVPSLPSLIKYWHDTYQIKFVVSGSSSFYLRNHFTESLAGRKRIFEMHPLTFSEFIQFRGGDVEAYRKFRGQPFHLSFYLKWKALYEEYLRFGGFPQVALEPDPQEKSEILKEIINAHLEMDMKLLSDFSISDQLYRLITLLAVRSGSKIDLSQTASILGINRNKVKDLLLLLEHTYFVHLVPVFSKNVEHRQAKTPKIYLSDTGILQALAQVSSGQLFETAIAHQLRTKGKISYFQKQSGREIDFILNDDTAIEVKETPAPTDAAKLYGLAQGLGISDTRVVGRYQPNQEVSNLWWGGSLD